MDSKRSCCSTITCCGIPIEKGCFIFSIINAIICSLATLGSLGFLGFAIYTWFDGESRGPNDMVLVYLFTGIAAGSVVGAAIALTFAILLCVGVRKNKKRYIMAYLVYGIVTVILSVAGTIAFVWMEWGDVELLVYSMIPLGICLIYSVLLLLVYQTYVVLSEDTPVPAHRRLLNTNDF